MMNTSKIKIFDSSKTESFGSARNSSEFRHDQKSLISDKKGDVTTSTIITIVVLLAGFAILLFVLWQIFSTGKLDEKTCHTSVILRATMPTIAEGFVPLKCKTGKYCITSKLTGECDEFKGEGAFDRLIVRKKADIEKAITEKMFDCWSMMGEGKVTLFDNYLANTYGYGRVYSSCVICGRIALADDIKENLKINPEDIDVNAYMFTHKVSGSDKTYWEYLSGGKSAVSIEEDFEVYSVDKDEKNQYRQGEKIENIEIVKEEEADKPEKQISVTFMQINSPSGSEVFENTVKEAGLSLIGSGILAPKFTLKAIGAAIFTRAGIITTAILATVGLTTQRVNVAWNKAIAARYCGDVKSGNENIFQCSVARLTNYDAEALNKYCSYIESIP